MSEKYCKESDHSWALQPSNPNSFKCEKCSSLMLEFPIETDGLVGIKVSQA